MKSNKIKGLIIIIALLLLGVVIIVLNKFAFSINYSKNVRLEIHLGKDFEISDVLAIVSDVYKEQNAIVRKSGGFSDTITVTLRAISDEQNEEFVNKLNEKYETSFTTSDLNIYYNSNVRGTDMIKPYIAVSIIVAVIIIGYFAVRYRKIGMVRAILGPIMVGIGTQVLYLCLMSIFRMEINEGTIASGIAIIIFCLMYLINCYEKELKATEK